MLQQVLKKNFHPLLKNIKVLMEKQIAKTGIAFMQFFAIAVCGMYELKNNLFKKTLNDKPNNEKIKGILI